MEGQSHVIIFRLVYVQYTAIEAVLGEFQDMLWNRIILIKEVPRAGQRVQVVICNTPGVTALAEDDAFDAQLERGLAAIPGTAGRAVTSALPRSRGLASAEIAVPGETPERNEAPRASWLAVGRDYFETLGIALRSGRDRISLRPRGFFSRSRARSTISTAGRGRPPTRRGRESRRRLPRSAA